MKDANVSEFEKKGKVTFNDSLFFAAQIFGGMLGTLWLLASCGPISNKPISVNANQPIPPLTIEATQTTTKATETATKKAATPIPPEKNLRETSIALKSKNIYSSFEQTKEFPQKKFDEISANVFSIEYDNGLGGLNIGSATFFKTNDPENFACITTAVHSKEGLFNPESSPDKVDFERTDEFGNVTRLSATPNKVIIYPESDEAIFCFRKVDNQGVDFPKGVEIVNAAKPDQNQNYLAIAYPGAFQDNTFQVMGRVLSGKNSLHDDNSIMINGDMSEGGSGGGLFNTEGKLIGVINGHTQVKIGDTIYNYIYCAKVTIPDNLVSASNTMSAVSQTPTISSK